MSALERHARWLLILCLAACTSPGRFKNQQGGSLAVDNGGKLWVALADNDGVAVVDPSAKSGRLDFIPTGHRPERVIVRGEFAYVSNRFSRSITQIEVSSRKVLQNYKVDAEPIGLDTTDNGQTLVVANAMSGTIVALNTQTGEVKWRHELVGDQARAVFVIGDQRVYAPSFSNGTMHVLDLANGEETNTFDFSETADPVLARRPTGVESIASDGRERVFLPHSASLLATLDGTSPGFYATAAGANSASLSPIIASVTTIHTPGDQVLHQAKRIDFPAPFQPASANSGLAGPKAIAVSLGGDVIFAVNQFSNTVAVYSNRVSKHASKEGLLDVISVGAGPTGVAIARDDQSLYVHNAFDQSISVLRPNGEKIVVAQVISDIADQILTAEEQRGRRLFYAASDPQMSGQAAGGIACASCHPDGRQDGHTWSLTEGRRNTPSLVGRHLERTAPYNRDGQLVTAQDFGRVISERMGGQGVTGPDLDSIFTWLENEPAPDNPFRVSADSLTPDQRAGRLTFMTKGGCVSCHSGADFTDSRPAEVGTKFTSILLTEPTRPPTRWSPTTPPLLGAFSSAPYLHDGSAATLEELIRKNGAGLHGNTAGLSDEEIKQLAAFLQAL